MSPKKQAKPGSNAEHKGMDARKAAAEVDVAFSTECPLIRAPPGERRWTTAAPPLRLLVIWLNIFTHIERAQHVLKLIDAAREHNKLHRVRMTIETKRFEALVPWCKFPDEPCSFNQSHSFLNESEVFALETAKSRLHTHNKERAGIIGNWLSHVNAYTLLLHDPKLPDLLLVLEDDAQLSPNFFELIPCLLRKLPSEAGAVAHHSASAHHDASAQQSASAQHDASAQHSAHAHHSASGRHSAFHVVRFGCWGKSFVEDRVNASSSEVYYARHHHFNVSESCRSCAHGVAYGGAHATLVQRKTAGELVAHLLQHGVMPIDVALRETPGHRQLPGGSPSQRRREFNDAVASKLRSYVIHTPSASVAWDDAALPGWRPNSHHS